MDSQSGGPDTIIGKFFVKHVSAVHPLNGFQSRARVFTELVTIRTLPTRIRNPFAT
jgi:hypothetical protein